MAIRPDKAAEDFDPDDELTDDELLTDIRHQAEVLWCPACKHEHSGAQFGFICIGCICRKTPPFRKLAL